MIPLFKVHVPPNVGEEIQKVFDAGTITEGDKSDEFEMMLGNWLQNNSVALVNSCTSALTLAYDMSNIGPGDEVISTPMTCMATNEPIHLRGAKIVWADIDPSTGNIDANSVKQRITSKTKAIVGVHWAGLPFDIDPIKNIADNHGISLIEDAAHALGAKYKNAKIGSHSHYTCFSFQAIKHLTTGDGGAISTLPGDNSIQTIRKIKWFGLDRKYPGQKWSQDIDRAGYKFHMNNINATIGILQMRNIDKIVNAHISNGKFYDASINNKHVRVQNKSSNCESSYWIYSVLVKDPMHFQSYMRNLGIATDVVHVRNDRYSVFRQYRRDDLPGCDDFCSKLMNIPVGWWLSESEKIQIVDAVNSYPGS